MGYRVDCRELLMIIGFFLVDHRALCMDDRSHLMCCRVDCRAFLIDNGVLLVDYTALLMDNRSHLVVSRTCAMHASCDR